MRKRRLWLTACTITLLVAVTVVGMAYYVIPLMTKPRNLGIKPTQEAYMSVMKKLCIEVETFSSSAAVSSNNSYSGTYISPPAQKTAPGDVKEGSPTASANSVQSYQIKYGPPHEVSASLTSEELTSFTSANNSLLGSFQSIQVRANSDGTVEASGTVDSDLVFKDLLNGKYTKEDLQKSLPMLGSISDSISFYLKASGTIENNLVQSLKITSLQVMGGDNSASGCGFRSFLSRAVNRRIHCQRMHGFRNIHKVSCSQGRAD